MISNGDSTKREIENAFTSIMFQGATTVEYRGVQHTKFSDAELNTILDALHGTRIGDMIVAYLDDEQN